MQLFGRSYSDGEGKQFASDIEATMLNTLEAPILFAGDFNAPKLFVDFPRLIGALGLSAAHDEQATDVHGNRMDYILYSKEFSIENSEMIHTEQADHYPLWAEVTARS